MTKTTNFTSANAAITAIKNGEFAVKRISTSEGFTKEEVAENRKAIRESRMLETEAVIEGIKNEMGVSETVASAIFSRAWETSHSSGWDEVKMEIDELIDFANIIMNEK